MKKTKAVILAASAGLTALTLSGCGVSGPTYGTDKTSTQQLWSDLSNMTALKSDNQSGKIDTKPRPDLVPPSRETMKSLPQPQENVAQTGAPDWPESPEQRRQRLRDEATANQDNPNYVPSIKSRPSPANYMDTDVIGLDGMHRGEDQMNTKAAKAQRAEYMRRKQENSGGTANNRKYLSEPPLTYREPAATAPVGEKGEDESVKERQRKAAMKGKSDKKWYWPF